MDSKVESNSKSPRSDKWVQVWSRSKPGKCYYFNVKTKESSWTRPEGFVEEQDTTSTMCKETKTQRKRKQPNEALPSPKKSESCPPDKTKRRNSLRAGSPVQDKNPHSIQSNVALREDILADKNGRSGIGKDQIAHLKNIDGIREGQRHSDGLDVSQTKETKIIVFEDNSVAAHPQTNSSGLEIPPSKVGEVRRRKIRARRKNKRTAPVSGDIKPRAASAVSSSVKTYHNATGIVCDKPAILHNVSSTPKSDENEHMPKSTKSKLVNGLPKGTTKEPAQARLNELQNNLKRSHNTKKQPDTPKKDLKLAKSPKKFKNFVVDHPIHSDSVDVRPGERRLANVQSKFKHEQEQHRFIPVINEDSDGDAMEIEYMESEVLIDIGEYRLKEFAVEFTEQPTFMDVDDVDYSVIGSNPQSLCYIVLDTNILLGYLKFVEGLRDSIIPGKGPVHLFLPWQVIHELDQLKDKGRPSTQPHARRAINYLHDNFSCKHPRVRGQKLSEANLSATSCPDDKILQSCIQLKDQGHDVILLSNDKNLLNKALISEVSALSKDELANQLNENPASHISANVVSNNPDRNNMLEKENIRSASRNDTICCEMKAIIKDTLGEVVSWGMEDEYKHLWQKRTITPPPWEADEVLHCLSYHWLPLCGDFIPDSVKSSIEQLKIFLKRKRYGVSDSDLKESLDLTKTVFGCISKKYIKTTKLGIQNIKALLQRMDNSSPTPDVHNESTVLVCFEEAHNAAQRLCSSSFAIDPEWKQKAGYMIEAVQTLIRLLTLILSKPPDFMSEEDVALNELVNLIKGKINLTPKDMINFCKNYTNRTLLENGIQQFATIELQLTSMLHCST